MRIRQFFVLAMVLLLLSACSPVQKRQVIAVNSVESGGPAARVSGSAFAVPLPPAVRGLLDQAEQDLQAGHFDLSEKRLLQAQRIVPSEPRVYLLWGQWAQAQERFAQAEQMYRRVLSLSGRENATYIAAQRALQAMGFHQEY